MQPDRLADDLLDAIVAAHRTIEQNAGGVTQRVSADASCVLRRALRLVDDLRRGDLPPRDRELDCLGGDLLATIEHLEAMPDAIASSVVSPQDFDRIRAVATDLRHHPDLLTSPVEVWATFAPGPPTWFDVGMTGDRSPTGGGFTLEAAIGDLADKLLRDPPSALSPTLLTDRSRLVRWITALTPTPARG